ncbi:hypothetical protein [Sphaerisporangium aureirubrum]|uniref:Uncharacterized protein n=1 Tax=Sphaerisporangium aureirubrum TaxID=1544736 RepID=A0ABW1NK25_9ACTN
MRRLAAVVLRLYPRTWRARYGDEMRDLIASRPVRIHTLADLVLAAADAWAHRRMITAPGRRGPAPAPSAQKGSIMIFVLGTFALTLLWNPGIRHVPSLDGGWAAASAAGPLADVLASVAAAAFDAAAYLAVLAFLPPAAQAVVNAARRPHPATAAVLLAAPFLALGALGPVYLQISMSRFDVGFPVGPLGNAITGGFFAPMVIEVGLLLYLLTREAPGLSWGPRLMAYIHVACAALIVGGWVPSAVLVGMGAPGESARFFTTVAASALCSVAIALAGAAVSLRFTTARPAAAPSPATGLSGGAGRQG